MCYPVWAETAVRAVIGSLRVEPSTPNSTGVVKKVNAVTPDQRSIQLAFVVNYDKQTAYYMGYNEMTNQING